VKEREGETEGERENYLALEELERSTSTS